MTREQIGLLLGGLGMFLFGTMAFEEAIGFLVTKKFKNLLKTATNTLIKSIGTGVFATAILQSSAVVSLIAISFIGAGIIDLSNAVGIILGTNIGAPLMDILLGNLGLKFSLSSIALPVIGLSGIGFLVFAKNIKIKHIFRAVFGIGLIFLGLDFMKDSMMALSSVVDFSQYISLSIFAYFGIGFVATVLMQSSSATTILVLAAASSGIVGYRMGVPIIMGAFLATTMTAVLGSIGPSALKKQVAFSHVFFNLFSVILGFVFFSGILAVLEGNFVDIVVGLSVFAIGFKIICVVLMTPFVGYFTRFLQWIFPVKETKLGLSLEQVDPNVTEAVIVSMNKDTIKLLKKIFVYVLHIWSVDEKMLLRANIDVQWILNNPKYFDESSLNKEYDMITIIEGSLVLFGTEAKRYTTKLVDVQRIDELFSVVSSSVATAKYMKDISHNISSLEDSSYVWIHKQYDLFREMLVSLYKIVSEVIDGQYSDEILLKMIDLVQDIKESDKIFLKNLTKEFSKDKVKKFDLSDVLHVNRYVYLSSLSFVEAVNKLLLKESEKKIFEQLK